jgi:uncharacterized protein YndB with AHSA1/START domain
MNESPVATAGMLIRKPLAQVYEAFIDPAVTSRFWFSRGSDRLDAGRPVQWVWEDYGVTVDVDVRTLAPNERILIDWSAGGEPATMVEWTFRELPDGTFVDVENRGFAGDDEAVVAQALDSVGGFTLLMAGAKAWLEHGIELNLVRDRYPAGL